MDCLLQLLVEVSLFCYENANIDHVAKMLLLRTLMSGTSSRGCFRVDGRADIECDVRCSVLIDDDVQCFCYVSKYVSTSRTHIAAWQQARRTRTLTFLSFSSVVSRHTAHAKKHDTALSSC